MVGVDINTLIMEQYLALSRENQAPGVVKPEIRGNVNFEIESQFMRELREDTFSENKNEDAHDHVDRVLNIVSLFNIPGISQDAVLLRVFPFTLTGSAKIWVDRLTPGAVNTWDLLKKAFIQRYCSPSKTTKRLGDIHNFKQEGDESLYQAWERNISSSSDTDGLTAVISKLDNLGRDMKKLKENVHAIQVGCQICKGPHLDKECPLNKEVKQVDEFKYGEFGRPTPFSTEVVELSFVFGEVSETARDKILRGHWRKIFENEYDNNEEFEDPDGCKESKENEILGTILNKLHDEWFKGIDEDDDHLEGIIDYLEPTLYDRFVDSDDEEYKEVQITTNTLHQTTFNFN
ncbi:putative reverse transcriptase domain-containing protein [Tanacetum coccineum]